jgi:hypothetical protein
MTDLKVKMVLRVCQDRGGRLQTGNAQVLLPRYSRQGHTIAKHGRITPPKLQKAWWRKEHIHKYLINARPAFTSCTRACHTDIYTESRYQMPGSGAIAPRL